MKLDYNYLRDVMIAIEAAERRVTTRLRIDGLIQSSPTLQKHFLEETYFVLTQLEDAKLADVVTSATMDADIGQLTFAGNEFLNNIRSDKVWKSVLTKVAKTAGSASLTIVANLAQLEMSKRLGLN